MSHYKPDPETGCAYMMIGLIICVFLLVLIVWWSWA